MRNSSSEALAQALELVAADGPAAGTEPLRVLWRYRAEDSPGLAPDQVIHDLYGDLPAMRLQAARFLASGGAGLCDPRSGCD